MLRPERQGAVLFGVLLVEAPQVSQLLDHLGIQQLSAWVVELNVGLQDLRQSVLERFDPCMVLDAWAVCSRERERLEAGLYLESRVLFPLLSDN